MTSPDFLSLAKQYFPEESIYKFTYEPGFYIKGSALFNGRCGYFLLQYYDNTLHAVSKLSISLGNHDVYPARPGTEFLADTLDDYIKITNPTKEDFIYLSQRTIKLVKDIKLKLKMENIKNDFT